MNWNHVLHTFWHLSIGVRNKWNPSSLSVMSTSEHHQHCSPVISQRLVRVRPLYLAVYHQSLPSSWTVCISIRNHGCLIFCCKYKQIITHMAAGARFRLRDRAVVLMFMSVHRWSAHVRSACHPKRWWNQINERLAEVRCHFVAVEPRLNYLKHATRRNKPVSYQTTLATQFPSKRN